MSNPLQPLAVGMGRQVAELEKRAAHALRVFDLVRSALPEPEKSHVLSASYREDTLVISVESAMWTAHVRYREQALLRCLIRAGE
ncbi:MAG TPA: DciA family protein, partial [Steroidobacteraceae bacterium]|nr:DciA family protein [Steroidobacteraceae bacterium]